MSSPIKNITLHHTEGDFFESLNRLQEVDTEPILTETLAFPEKTGVAPSCGLLAEKVEHTTAEINIVQNSPLSILPDSKEVHYGVIKEELEKSISELNDTLTFINAEARELEIEIHEEGSWNDQISDVVLDSLAKRLNEQNFETNDAEGAKEKLKSEIADKTAKANIYFKQLLKDSSQFCSKYFKLPSEEEFNDVQKKLRSADKTVTVRNMLSLKDIISELMNKCFDEPNHPYIVLDKRYWPPYVELLLRCQIVVRHPDDPRRVKLIPFHL
ncbi:centromere protein K-like [Mytilus californianus]|uniref:centromere protein K-like n=1 Tax=Mytilus californianus TaxID=6549 RepID=UPI00224861D1|nr:centromere protein K-like [Mytilus californianus]